MQKQIKYKSWEITFSLCHQLGVFGRFGFPFCVGWWYSEGIGGSKNFEIGLGFLCFTFDIDVWKWEEDETKTETSID